MSLFHENNSSLGSMSLAFTFDAYSEAFYEIGGQLRKCRAIIGRAAHHFVGFGLSPRRHVDQFGFATD